METLSKAEEYTKKQNLEGNAFHGSGRPPSEYNITYIPHKVIIDKDGVVVKNFDMKLPDDLDKLI